VLFVEREDAAGSQLEQDREHPLVQQYREKCYVVNPRYKGIPYLPGVYASIRRKWYDRSRIRSGHYLEVRENEHFQYKGSVPDDGFLYSFRGKLGTAPMRGRMAMLSHPRGLIEDTTAQNITPMMATRARPDELQSYQREYAELVAQSKFVLCPRGTGPSSLRLFETMCMGRVPVVLSDQWVPPEGPDWNEFAIRVPERHVHMIPELLQESESHAGEMGRLARQAWEDWFSPEVAFHRVVQWCLDIERTAVSPTDVFRRYRSFAWSFKVVRSTEQLAETLSFRYSDLKRWITPVIPEKSK